MRGVKYIRVIVAGLGAGLLLVSSSAFAAEPTQSTGSNESILLTPTQKRYEVKPGEVKRDSLTVVNDGQLPYVFVVYARPYYVDSESYSPKFDTPAVSDIKIADTYRWVQFDQPSYQIQPGQSLDIPFTMRVPRNASPGGHYGVLFAETQPSQSPEAGNSVRRTKRVGAITYVTVDGNVTRNGKLESTSVPFFQFKKPVTASTRVSSSGNTDIVTKTSFTVSDVFGTVKFRNERELTVLPSTTRKIDSTWNGASWIGLYKVDLRTSFLNTTETSSHYVLLVPIWVYLTLVVLIGARIAYGLKRRRKTTRKK